MDISARMRSILHLLVLFLGTSAFASTSVSASKESSDITGSTGGNLTESSTLQDSTDVVSGSSRSKRSVFHLYNMMTCATDCNPLSYKGYGCYCGFLGSGVVVDGIDKCCSRHDACYYNARCPLNFLHYFVSYVWTCRNRHPQCVTSKGPLGGVNSCGHQLCECDRQFAECLKHYPCPKRKAMCMTSPWRNNFILGSLGREASIAIQTLL